MKQRLLLASALLAATYSQAQTTVDFEDLTLPSVDTFYTGEDNTGQFSSNNVIFQNSYETTQWGYSWGGFAYSNMTDDQTAGYGNQYSAFAGGGDAGSDNYAIYFSSDTLILPGTSVLGDVSITNTTYAGISMRDGDQFAKQFGSPNGADGQPDGTNGEDYFYVTFYGWDNNDILVDSVQIYLADYRFSDNNQDYILKDWTTFNLSNLDGVDYITFSFASSDVGEFGINTPLYFAMDNLVYSEYINDVKEQKSLKLDIYPNPTADYIVIEGNFESFYILTNQGTIVMKGETSNGKIDISSLPRGIYYVTDEERSITKKLIIQ